MGKIQELYDIMNSSERFGSQFGMFPYDKCKGLTREESIDLMHYGKEQRYK